jgi:Transposase DDE domain
VERAYGGLRHRRIEVGSGGGAGLTPSMLCLADRFFPSYQLWQAATKTGAALLWRTRQNVRLDVDRRLSDGSYLSRIYASTSDRRKQRQALLVRAIDYRLKDVPNAEPVYRLITTILDPKQAPTKELAALYHERWEIETALDELKTHLRGAQIVLRSKTPDLVEQEFLRPADGPLCRSRLDA